ncbi:MAG: cysteine desulfurase [Deltaproteobacteria bacterium]|nr:cysteine desulfurase [Deltaproteobacteria bacterium]
MNIYLDNNATTRLDARVRDAMRPFMGDRFGNPSSIHAHGQDARFVVDDARTKVAALINGEPEEIIFTSGGTESCNMALLGHCRQQGVAARILASRVEHPAVLKCAEFIEETRLAQVDWINVTTDGVIDLTDVYNRLKSAPTLMSVMSANNDVGVIMPLPEIIAAAHAQGALVHTDAVQAVGKIPMDVKASGVDLLSCSAHKLRGPMGIGALYIKRGTRLKPMLFGGHQEYRKRPGTENVAAIAGFGAACELAQKELSRRTAHICDLKHLLEEGLHHLPAVIIYGETAPRLPGTCYAGFGGIEGETLQMALDMRGFSVSVGSACSSETRDPSHVLTAMGVSPRDAARAIRFSLGPDNTEDEIHQLLSALGELVPQLRSQ